MRTTTMDCSSCGQSVTTFSNFCPNCGTKIAPTDNSSINITHDTIRLEYNPETVTSQERNWALLCHLATLVGWIIPFSDLIATAVIWSIHKDTSNFVGFHGKEALNYQISFYIYTIIAVVLSGILIGIPILILLTIIDVTVPIIMAIKASNGERKTYPFIFRIVQ